jgi:sugar phosphate isomerase/epimerase
MKKELFVICFLLLTIGIQSQEIGIQLYSVRNEVKNDLKGTLQKVRAMGIKELEGGDLYGMKIQDYKKMLDEMGYKMISIGVDYNALTGDLSKTISDAKALGATYVVCFWIGHNGNEFGMKDVEEAASRFNRAGKILKEAGLNFCYHPHGYEFRSSANGTLFDDLVAKTNPEYANFELDVFWAKQGCADPVAILKKYPSRMKMLHLKDREHGTVCNDTGGADEETNVVLGKGDVNIKAVMKAARKAGVKHYFIEDESSRVMQQVPLSLQFLSSLK